MGAALLGPRAGGAGRVFSGLFRVELGFNDQQWTQRALQYEYVVPWRAVALYPAAWVAVVAALPATLIDVDSSFRNSTSPRRGL